MVPSAFVVLERAPAEREREDRPRALPVARRGCRLGSGGAARRTRWSWSCAVWAEFLGLRSIGVDDNFFELGGHSLLAVRLFARASRTSFGRRLPLATLFQAPTIERLAAVIREEGRAAPWSSLVVIQGGGASSAPFFCIPGVGGNVLGFHTLQPGTSAPTSRSTASRPGDSTGRPNR